MTEKQTKSILSIMWQELSLKSDLNVFYDVYFFMFLTSQIKQSTDFVHRTVKEVLSDDVFDE